MSGALTLSDLLGDRSAMRAFSPEEVGSRAEGGGGEVGVRGFGDLGGLGEWHGLSLSAQLTHANALGPRRALKQPHHTHTHAHGSGQVAASAAQREVSSVSRKVVSMLKTDIVIRHTHGGQTQSTLQAGFKQAKCKTRYKKFIEKSHTFTSFSFFQVLVILHHKQIYSV